MKNITRAFYPLLNFIIILSMLLTLWAPLSMAESVNQPEEPVQVADSPSPPAPEPPSKQDDPKPDASTQEAPGTGTAATDSAGQGGLEVVSDPVTVPETVTGEDGTDVMENEEQNDKEYTENEAEEELEEAVKAIPFFCVTCELDHNWLAQWQAGKRHELMVHYTICVSDYNPLYATCTIYGIGLKEVRELRANETEEDLMHIVGLSNKKLHFQEGNTSYQAEFIITERVLAALPEGEYQIYILYTDASGEEQSSIFGGIRLPWPEEEDKPEDPVPTVSVEALLVKSGERAEMVLTAELTGFGQAEAQLQWQVQTGEGWNDIDGANGYEYRFDPSEATNDYQWRVKVTLPSS